MTPERDPDRLMTMAAAALRGGADVFQLRHKQLGRGELLALARRLRELTREAGAIFVVNDHVDLALLCEADGVHLGADDLSLAAARHIAADRLLIGASASTPDVALAAIESGADYIGCGPAFATPLKPQKAVIGPSGVAAVMSALDPSVPVFAIGGIDASNIAQLTAAGVRRACVVRAVGEAPDPEAAARGLRAMLEA
ncbi:MAG TPA: thiamine phosphate synthase [Candidatus Acidoferrum sp.]|nr:thiamine phosphate synthase [Candidatus Acidoferrum sp.]